MVMSKFMSTIIRNLSLTLENTVESTTKIIDAQQTSLDSLTSVVLDNGIASDCLLAEQGSVCAAANTPCCTWNNTSGEATSQLHKVTEQKPFGLKKMTLSARALTYLILVGLSLGDHR